VPWVDIEDGESIEMIGLGLIAAATGEFTDSVLVLRTIDGRGVGAVAGMGGFEGRPRGAILVYTAPH
jgi:hypothetical protein